MLKQGETVNQCALEFQPPSGGCVLKPAVRGAVAYAWYQPPSGGCVLKQVSSSSGWALPTTSTAAFGRLCVETG